MANLREVGTVRPIIKYDWDFGEHAKGLERDRLADCLLWEYTRELYYIDDKFRKIVDSDRETESEAWSRVYPVNQKQWPGERYLTEDRQPADYTHEMFSEPVNLFHFGDPKILELLCWNRMESTTEEPALQECHQSPELSVMSTLGYSWKKHEFFINWDHNAHEIYEAFKQWVKSAKAEHQSDRKSRRGPDVIEHAIQRLIDLGRSRIARQRGGYVQAQEWLGKKPSKKQAPDERTIRDSAKHCESMLKDFREAFVISGR